jgi:hypothetical protein
MDMTNEITSPPTDTNTIEGLDTAPDADLSQPEYPIDTLMIRTESRTVHDVLRRIERGDYIMHPDFQRDFVWNEEKQSKLIESVLMRIPLPVFYFAENDDGKHVIVDGLQRITTFKRFVNNEFKLRLRESPELNGKRFENLPVKLKNRIEDCNLTLYLIDAKVGERIRLDIFERVNNGVPLTRQQMRNCLFNGGATQFLKEQATDNLFVLVTGGSLNVDQMRDREFVNRFCAFYLLGHQTYRGDMDEFLASALKHMNQMSPAELERLGEVFTQSLKVNYKLFERHAFRKFTDMNHNRSVINASLWDVLSTVFIPYLDRDFDAKHTQILDGMRTLFSESEFNSAITISTNDTKKVVYRFERVNTLMQEIFDDNSDSAANI